MARLALIDELLAQQRTLTAVESFARKHDAGELPDRASVYRELIPASAPGPNQQYAFEVDIDACTGCKGCVTACHRMNGLESGETWRRVGTLQGGDATRAVRQTITTACHHCLEPACAAGCPVEAYDKDPITGIVKHLDDQCIGCKYCLFTCPYEVPQYSASKGIVRKCDMCSSRLSAGEAPACVQACPNQAISIRVVDTAQVVEEAESHSFLPGAPDPGVTLPSTAYVSKRPLPRNTLPADYYVTRPEAAHPPLALMLVLTQVAVGVFGATQLVGDAWAGSLRSSLIALAVALVALGASTLHLGRPLYAFRAVLGLRRSWLSREIVAFGAFVGATCAYVAATRLAPGLSGGIGIAAALIGAAAVHSSVMVYVATRRECWRLPLSAGFFYRTTVVGGCACLLAIAAVFAVGSGGGLPREILILGQIGAACLLLSLGWELWLLRHARARRHTALRRRADLLLGEVKTWTQLRYLLGFGGLCAFGAVALWGHEAEPVRNLVVAVTGALLVVGGELAERHLFFVASPAPRMPGESP